LQCTVIVGAISSIFFTLIVFAASFITTYFMETLERPPSSSYHSGWFFGYHFISPFEVGADLLRAAFRILREESEIVDAAFAARRPHVLLTPTGGYVVKTEQGLLLRLLQRFLLGLPLVGAMSLVHILISSHMLAPVQWIARYRASRSNNRRGGNVKDVAALLVLLLLVVGAAR
jgi:hypothetical protein